MFVNNRVYYNRVSLYVPLFYWYEKGMAKYCYFYTSGGVVRFDCRSEKLTNTTLNYKQRKKLIYINFNDFFELSPFLRSPDMSDETADAVEGRVGKDVGRLDGEECVENVENGPTQQQNICWGWNIFIHEIRAYLVLVNITYLKLTRN